MEFGLELEPNTLTPESPAYMRLQGPNQWPTDPSDLAWKQLYHAVVIDYMTHLQKLSERLLELMAEVLEADVAQLLSWFRPHPHIRMKVVRYPGLSEANHVLANAESLLGVGPHKDYGFFGLLLQDNVGGLQYQQNANAEWIDATPVDDTFVVTLGEMVEAATDGHFPATVRISASFVQSHSSICFFMIISGPQSVGTSSQPGTAVDQLFL